MCVERSAGVIYIWVFVEQRKTAWLSVCGRGGEREERVCDAAPYGVGICCAKNES